MLPTIRELILDIRKKREIQRKKQKERTSTFRKKLNEF